MHLGPGMRLRVILAALCLSWGIAGASESMVGRSIVEVIALLETQGVETRPIVTGNITRHPVAKLFPETFAGEYPGGDAIHTRGFYLGLSPVQADKDMARLLACFENFLRKY